MGWLIKILKASRMAILSIRFGPHLAVFLLRREIFRRELEFWLTTLAIDKSGITGFLHLLIFVREYRTIFYMRSGGVLATVLSTIAPGRESLYINTPESKIGKGLIIQHGHSTRIGANKIGEQCQVWHNVTIGKRNSGSEMPNIGNNVMVCTGAVIIGGISIGDNVVIGAGAIVTKDIPANCVIVGNPAYILKRDGRIVNEKL